jgi:hypothetical protein
MQDKKVEKTADGRASGPVKVPRGGRLATMLGGRNYSADSK